MKVQPIKNRCFGLLAQVSMVIFAFISTTSAQEVDTCANGDGVMEWNCRAVARILSSGMPPPRQLRAMAIVQVSVQNAVNGITGKYETYYPSETEQNSPQSGSAEAAAVAAAYRALLGLFPASQTELLSQFGQSLNRLSIPAADPGLDYGTAAAVNVLGLRSNDGNAQATCQYLDLINPSPGEWVRITNPGPPLVTPPAALPCWKNVTPWVLQSSSQFQPEAPPALDSEQYGQDLAEVLSVGALNGSTRSSEQTQIATFWNGSPVNIWNQVLRQAAASQDLDLSAKARAFALVYMAGTDASIACWEAKYSYKRWRPVTAIHFSDPTSAWDSYIPTWEHQHPEYPSGHSTVSSSLGSAMILLLDDEPGITLTPTVTTTIRGTTSNVTRSWESFGQAIDEVVDARVYSGIHFRYADEAGARLGGQAARFVFTHALRQCTRGKKCG